MDRKEHTKKFLGICRLNSFTGFCYCHTKRDQTSMSQCHFSLLNTRLTFMGLAAEIDCRGVKACMVCETPAANMNSSLSSVLVLPRALGGKFKSFSVKFKNELQSNSENNF